MRSLDARTIEEKTNEILCRVVELENENESLMNVIAENRLQIDALNESLTRVLEHAPKTLQQTSASCDYSLRLLESMDD